MAELSGAARKNLPKTKLALPKKKGKSGYPIEDREHAGNAKSRASGQYNAGGISKSTRDRVFAKANKVLARKKKT